MERLLTYGLLENSLKHISEVKNGLACKCVCANCKHPLVAKNNPANKKMAHFAHQSGNECAGAIETTLHLLAKATLQKTKQLTLPRYHYDYNHFNKNSIFKQSSNLIFENIILEKTIIIEDNKIIPDAIGEIKNKQIFIEFANTHFVNDDKKEKIKQLGIACIEIDLREQFLDEELLIEFFNSDSIHKYWIINQRLDNEYEHHKMALLEQEKLRKQQLIIKEQNKIKVGKSKFELYSNNKDYKILSVKDEDVVNCPLRRKTFDNLKLSQFYTHDVLKKIIDGAYWNGQIYGYASNGKWIFLEQKKVFVYPPDEMCKNLSEQENRNNKLFFAGLSNIIKIRGNPSFGDCRNCKFTVDYFSYENLEYEVCKHP